MAVTNWFDSHAHLQDEAFDADRGDVLDRAWRQGVRRVLLPSSSFSDARRAIALASQDERLLCAVGCHPHEAAAFSGQTQDDWHALVEANRQTPIVAIGEIGLDYHYDFSPREVQRQVFWLQLTLAHALGLPVIIHEREATSDCLSLLEKAQAAGLLAPEPGVFHCFSGSAETARIVLDMGFYLGFDGPVTFKNARKAPAVIEACPHDRLLLETDSPYLTPVPFRGKRNEPAYLPLIGEKVAQIWQMPADDVAAISTANACRLFRVAPADKNGVETGESGAETSC
ncbi:MAG: TatD family hydrolase [Eubacteriales bacterium]|nr:TatD family hydrolase [Clostridiales bacterium]MDD2440819.1 TatD family hydrolase [Eubacteriales bacterium]MDD4140091.1 TatD family hydrolase [Eubacteriales bacterium]MDD4743876.1 TatD family hydrolase [Eubacteriales bacterium]